MKLAPSAARALLERSGVEPDVAAELVGSGVLGEWVSGRDNASAKAVHLLATGRVEILYVAGDAAEWPVRAKVRGDEGRYSVGFNAGRWRCSCEANSTYRRRCSHIRAVALVVPPP